MSASAKHESVHRRIIASTPARVLHLGFIAFGISLSAPMFGAELLNPDLVAAQKLYVNRCAKCHKMYDPAKYTAAQWDTWMDKMGKKARLKPAQKDALEEYIETTLRHTAKKDSKPGDATAQR